MGEVEAQQKEFAEFEQKGFREADGVGWDAKTGLGRRFADAPDEPMTVLEAFDLKKELDAKKAKVEKVEEKKAGETADVKIDTAIEIAKTHSIVDLEALKGKIGVAGMGKLVEDVSISNEKLPTGLFQLSKNFDFKDLKPGIKGKFADKFKGKSFANLTDLLNKSFPGEDLKDDTAADFMADVYATSAIAKLKGLKRFDDFQSKMEDADAYQLSYEISVSEATAVNVELAANEKFDTAYTKFEKDVPEKPKTEVEKAADVKKGELLGRAHKLRTSPSGKFLSMLGIISIEGAKEGETAEEAEAREIKNDKAYAAALNGENFIASWVIWLFGGGAMLEDGGTAIAETVKGLDPKYGALVTKMHDTMEKGPLSLKKIAATLAVSVEAEKFEQMDNDKFGKFLGGTEKMPENGIKLIADYEVPANSKLSVDLKDGGEMVLPANKLVRLSDKSTIQAGEKAEERVTGKSPDIIQIIPAGTVFSAKASLKLNKLEA